MGEKRHELEDLKRQNPFRVPDGYMEGLTDRIMSQLPEETMTKEETSKVSFISRLRPWIAVAAAIVGIGFFINVFIGLDKQNTSLNPDSLWTQPQIASSVISEARTTYDEEYLEYLEARYSDYILEEEMADSE
ncbi:hypothetical protein [Massilibacteroides sp.]|uniref:hypothetical protein n=1 Tax=Massilibacteroides sp. TaxID=2034766 RepID=UPI0026267FE6|nr:hypothetical protein [Massilibacteroides sp.]MDD4516691.1 hypothetical protein [Massilibacteroides sp.]